MNSSKNLSGENQTGAEIGGGIGEPVSALPLSFVTVYFMLQGLEVCIAVIGNSLTIAAIIVYPNLQTATNFLAACLAAFDLSAVFALPFEVATYASTSDPWLWKNICLVSQVLGRMCTFGNAFFVMLIAMDRFVFITKPLRYHSIVTWSKVKVVGILAGMSIAATCIVSFFQGMSDRSPDDYCFDSNILSRKWKVFVFFFIVTTFTVTLVLYCKISLIVKKQRRAIQDEYLRFGATFPLGKERRMTSGMVVVMGFYFLSTVPVVLSGILSSVST